MFSESGGGNASVTLTDLGDGRTEMTFETRVRGTRAEAGLRSALDRLAEHLTPRQEDT